ncbi:DNA-binding HORMA family protein, partial [Prunus dulcis]
GGGSPWALCQTRQIAGYRPLYYSTHFATSKVRQLGFWLNSWRWQSLQSFSSKEFTLQNAKPSFQIAYGLSGIMGAFERRKYMNLVVHSARHPELRDYIHSAVSGLHPFIQKGLVERVAVIFFNSDSIPVERFIFKLTVNQSYGSRVEEADLEFSLRSFFIKLPFSESLTRVLPQDCRWEITAYFRSLPQTSTSKDAELWIPTDIQQWQQPPLITPIKSMSSEPLSVQLYLEHPGETARILVEFLEVAITSIVFLKGIYPPARCVSLTFITDCRWEITAYFRSLPQASTSKDAELWIPTDTQQWQQPPLITPIKS